MATWNGRSWGERGSNGVLVPHHGTKASVSDRVTLTAYAQTDVAGDTLPLLTMPISCGTATYADLRGDVGGNVHSLVYTGGTVDAVLVGVQGLLVKDSHDLIFATLDFIPITSDTTVQTISETVTVGGADYGGDVLEVTVSHGIDQVGQATVVFPFQPTEADTGAIVEVLINSNAVFSGNAAGRGWDYFPEGFAVDSRDRLDRLNYPYGGTERVYTSQTGGTIHQNLVEAMGIDSSNTHIEDDGNTIGVIEPIVFRQGDRFLPWVRTNDQLCGYVTYSKARDSAIYRTPYAYAGSIAASFNKGADIIDAHRKETIEGMYNGVQVDGFTYLGATVSVFLATANAYIPDPPGTVTYSTQSNIVETNTRGTAVATILLSKLNIRQEEYEWTTPIRTDLEPADSVTISHDKLHLSGGTVLITKVEHRLRDASAITAFTGRKVPE